jgi:hypothetical protein
MECPGGLAIALATAVRAALRTPLRLVRESLLGKKGLFAG